MFSQLKLFLSKTKNIQVYEIFFIKIMSFISQQEINFTIKDEGLKEIKNLIFQTNLFTIAKFLILS